MQVLNNIAIQAKILVAIGLMAALCLFIAGFGAVEVTALTAQGSGLVTNQAESLRIAALANQDAIRLQQQTLQWILATDPGEGPAWRAKIDEGVGMLAAKMDQLRPLLSGSDRARFAVAEQNFALYRTGLAPLDRFMAADDRLGAEHQMDRLSAPAYDRMAQALSDLVENQRVKLAAGRASMETTGALTWWTLLGVAVTGLIVLGGIVLVMVRRQITEPIRAITASMDRLAAGDTAIEPVGTDHRDEVGGMSRAVVVFRDAARELDRAQAEKARQDASQKLVVDTLEGALTTLAAGNLANDIDAAFPDEYAAVKTSYNLALANLRGLISGVAQSADGIRTGSQEIAQASEDLARRTEGDAASLEETSAALVQIDGRLKATAVSSGQTVARADQAIATVGGGRATAEEAVQAMGRVSDSAKGIDSVIEGLDKIAFQTRVLAMNAAVEAGRAGDAGRGFAVVADLVSALAMRSEEEAKRARGQLTTTQADIVTAVLAVQKVDGALANISSDVGEVHKLLGSMAEDATAQSSAITEISAAIGAMDKSTQQNAAMVEETSAAARNLTSEVGSLSDQAALFKTHDAAPVRRSAPAKAVQAVPYRSPVRASSAKPVAIAAATDDWNAF
jgi:methyl-accepting chemotaxis protein